MEHKSIDNLYFGTSTDELSQELLPCISKVTRDSTNTLIQEIKKDNPSEEILNSKEMVIEDIKNKIETIFMKNLQRLILYIKRNILMIPSNIHLEDLNEKALNLSKEHELIKDNDNDEIKKKDYSKNENSKNIEVPSNTENNTDSTNDILDLEILRLNDLIQKECEQTEIWSKELDIKERKLRDLQNIKDSLISTKALDDNFEKIIKKVKTETRDLENSIDKLLDLKHSTKTKCTIKW